MASLCHSVFTTVILSDSEESRYPTREILRFAQDDNERMLGMTR
jgi:hypothetical protein